MTPPSTVDRVSAALLALGTACRVLAVLTLLAVFALAKGAPEVDSVGLGGLLIFFLGLAVSPGWGLPMLLTGRMRVRAGLLGVMTGQTGDRAPVASGPSVRIFGALLTLSGGGAALLGAGLAIDGLPRLLA